MNIEKYYRSKQLVLANSLFGKDYDICNRSEKNKVNNEIKNLLNKYESIPFVIRDSLFELREYLKDFISNSLLTQKRLLQKERVRYIWFLKNKFLKEYNHIYYTTYYMNNSDSFSKRIYHIINDLYTDKVCDNPKCNNVVRFNSYSLGYSRFCCIKCSKNEEELKNINLFNGVNKGDIPFEERSRKEQYWITVRKLTGKNYRLYKDIINPYDLKLGINGFDDSHQIDHIISIKEGYTKGIKPEIIADVSNLRVVHWTVNNQKRDKFSDDRNVEKLPSLTNFND